MTSWIRLRSGRPVVLWMALVALVAVAQGLLVALTLSYESSRTQDQTDEVASEVATDIRRQVLTSVQDLQSLAWGMQDASAWDARAQRFLQEHRPVSRIEVRDGSMQLLQLQEDVSRGALFGRFPRDQVLPELSAACATARRTGSATLSSSYFVPTDESLAGEVMDVCLPIQQVGSAGRLLLATFRLNSLLEAAVSALRVQKHEVSIVEADGSRLARGGRARGAGIYVTLRLVDLPGRSIQLRVDSSSVKPSLIPNLAVALVLGLSLLLTVVLVLLARDVRRRALAERALAEALAFRKAMEDSLSTGLRARDLEGRLTYVNPAFCAMVGYPPEALLGVQVPPYWPPEKLDEYQQRQTQRLRLPAQGAVATSVGRRGQEGFETLFMRSSGERFPVMIYEAPLVDLQGRQTGWMSAALDLSEQRRVEDLSRAQQERLQATARLATVGEMASLLSHELNQPLSAIASYATGSLNLLDEALPPPPDLLRQALTRIADQAERAGRVIKSVHDFVRRREQFLEVLPLDVVVESVLPLVRLQARKSGVEVQFDAPVPSPRVRCDRTMIEQVVLNLARNGIQAMESVQPLSRRVLRLSISDDGERWVALSVSDQGQGIAPDVAERLFTPFFSTRAEGMGLGLSMCRTVIEQHGGALGFTTRWEGGAAGPGGPSEMGTTFRLTLPRAPKFGATTQNESSDVAEAASPLEGNPPHAADT